MRSVRISGRAAARVRGGHPWVRAAEILDAPAGAAEEAHGCVAVHDARGALVGSALWASGRPAEAIALRVYLVGAVRPLDRELLGARLDAAAAARRGLFLEADGYRVVHAEADGLPGLFVDRYGDALVVQTVAHALDRREAEIAALLVERFAPRLVVARDDTSARDREGLPRRKGVLAGAGPARATYHEGAAAYEVDLLAGPKTGAFLDQQENHAAAARYARPGARALDLFTCQGGFALAFAARGATVLAVDEAAAGLEIGRGAAARAGLAGRVTFEQDDAFSRLRRLEAAGERFDLVSVDPPALAKRHGPQAAAERGYVELNLRALRLLTPGGVLVTSSCSARVQSADFGDLLARAAASAGRSVQVLERRGAGRDHPGLLGVPETEYLKCWILRAL